MLQYEKAELVEGVLLKRVFNGQTSVKDQRIYRKRLVRMTTSGPGFEIMTVGGVQ